MGLQYARDSLNHGDDRPLRGNHKTASGRYPLLLGKWRSRVGASKFANQPKVRHLAHQIKQLYLDTYASSGNGPNERPAINVRAFFDAADHDQDGEWQGWRAGSRRVGKRAVVLAGGRVWCNNCTGLHCRHSVSRPLRLFSSTHSPLFALFSFDAALFKFAPSRIDWA